MASATVLQLLNAAAEELEVIPSGGSLTTLEQASALDRFNRMLDASSATKGLIYTQRMDTVQLESGEAAYTIGVDPAGVATADFALPRPVRITRATLLLDDDIRRDLKIWTAHEWSARTYRGQSGVPEGVYNDMAFESGLSTLTFDPVPDGDYEAELFAWRQNARVASVSAAIDYPPGYADFWLYSMVQRLAPMFGRAMNADHREMLRVAEETVKTLNVESIEMEHDAALVTGCFSGDWMFRSADEV